MQIRTISSTMHWCEGETSAGNYPQKREVCVESVMLLCNLRTRSRTLATTQNCFSISRRKRKQPQSPFGNGTQQRSSDAPSRTVVRILMKWQLPVTAHRAQIGSEKQKIGVNRWTRITASTITGCRAVAVLLAHVLRWFSWCVQACLSSHTRHRERHEEPRSTGNESTRHAQKLLRALNLFCISEACTVNTLYACACVCVRE